MDGSSTNSLLLWWCRRAPSCSGSDAASQDSLHSAPAEDAKVIFEFILSLLSLFMNEEEPLSCFLVMMMFQVSPRRSPVPPAFL